MLEQAAYNNMLSSYETFYERIGEEAPRDEKISEYTVTNIDPKTGKKYVKKERTYENARDKISKSFSTLSIDDKVMKRTEIENLETGKKEEKVEYENISESEIDKFKSEFEKGFNISRKSKTLKEGKIEDKSDKKSPE